MACMPRAPALLLACAACGGSSTIRIEQTAPPAANGADAGNDEDASGPPTSLPGASGATAYIPFEQLPPRTLDGTLVDVTGASAATVPGAIGNAVMPNGSTFSLASD